MYYLVLLWWLVITTAKSRNYTRTSRRSSTNPHQVEVCYDQQVSGDKSGDMLKGAIIGGIIGNNVGDIKNGGAAGVSLVVSLVT